MSVRFFQLSLDLIPRGSFTPHSALGRGTVAGAQTWRDSDLRGVHRHHSSPSASQERRARPEVCDVVRVRELYVALMFDKRLTIMCKISFVCNNR